MGCLKSPALQGFILIKGVCTMILNQDVTIEKVVKFSLKKGEEVSFIDLLMLIENLCADDNSFYCNDEEVGSEESFVETFGTE